MFEAGPTVRLLTLWRRQARLVLRGNHGREEMTRKLCLMTASGLMLLALAACGDNQSGDAQAPAAPDQSIATPPADTGTTDGMSAPSAPSENN
jgi:hypothetical protein